MTNQTQSKKKEINALLRLENKNIILAMTNEEAGALMKAIYVYGTEGVIPETLDRSLRLIFLVFKEDIDKDRKAYNEMCKRNATQKNAGTKRNDFCILT